MSEVCESCGVKWEDHLGVEGTCAKLIQRGKHLDNALEEIAMLKEIVITIGAFFCEEVNADHAIKAQENAAKYYLKEQGRGAHKVCSSRYCIDAGKLQPMTAFNKNRWRKDGRQGQCKSCCSIANKNYAMHKKQRN